MAIIKCKMCGGDVELSIEKTFGTCEFCGSTMTFPKVDDEQRAAAFNRGNHFRRIGEFDKALAVYERIVQEDDADAEAHWCCALCRFGIEYVEDPNTYEWLPTCHRLSFDSFLEDVDYLAAVEHSDGVTRRQYQKDAAKIAEVQRGILATSRNAESFDVFICYKESDENGERTKDSTLAQDIYYQLTEQGRRVFFARITLEDVAGSEYEPYIFAALNSAKVMVVVGTRPEHLNAVWVKNEWSRFLALMKKDRSKLLLPCYRDMDPYDMPEQLSVLQSYDMAKIGFIQDLTRGIAKVLDADKTTFVTVKETLAAQSEGNGNLTALLKRGNMALEDRKWGDAKGFFNRVLDMDPELAQAYLGLAMAYAKCRTQEEFRECYTSPTWEADSYTLRAKQYATPELKEMFERWDAEKAEKTEKAAEEARKAEERAAKEAAERAAKEAARMSELRQFYASYRKRSALASRRVCVNCETTRKDAAYIGLNLDGTVTGFDFEYNHPRRDVSDWTDIVAITASSSFGHIVGLKSDGTVVAVRSIGRIDFGQCNVSSWTDIVDIATGLSYTVGLNRDGTVVAVGNNELGQCNVGGWTDIVAVAADWQHTVGLKADGTVVAVGDNEDGQCDVGGWTDIVGVAAGFRHTVGLKADGTVVAVGDNKHGQCDGGTGQILWQ